MPAFRITVTGLVQGVFFRSETEALARSLGLKGWVRNSPDGSVEIHAEGDRDGIDTLIAWCHKGPPSARVDSVKAENTAPEGYGEFRIMR